jgi:uncharacterized protein YcbX
MNATVSALNTAAIKGTRLRSVQSIELGEHGAAGDRKFFVVDQQARLVNGKQLGALQALVATIDGERLVVEFPDGTIADDDLKLAESITAQFHSRTTVGRLVQGPWAQALSDYTGRNLRLLATDSAVDRGAKGTVTLISRGSLRRLAEQAQIEEVDARRFRMLIEIDGVAPHAEDAWIGQLVQAGEALVRFDGHVGRCLVTNRDPETGEVTLPTLDLLREYRGEVEATEPLPFGVYGRVVRGGRVRVGDALEFA